MQQTVLQEPDTIFLPIENLKGKVWVDASMANHEGTMLSQSFINDTVVKYYSGIAPSCWEENYTWEKFYDCYKIYGDTIEYIAKLVPHPKNDNKYVLNMFSWKRTYYRFKLFKLYNSTAGMPDTIMLLNNGNGLGYERYNTLTWLIEKKKITYPIRLNR